MKSDQLSSIRTHLANERTVLAYLRTALAFMGAGAGLINFFTARWVILSGWFFIAIGIAVLVFGAIRFFRIAHVIDSATREGQE